MATITHGPSNGQVEAQIKGFRSSFCLGASGIVTWLAELLRNTRVVVFTLFRKTRTLAAPRLRKVRTRGAGPSTQQIDQRAEVLMARKGAGGCLLVNYKCCEPL